MRARQAPRLFCGFVLVVGVCVVCVGPLGAACVVLGGGCVTNFHDLTGGVYKPRERIHRSVADLRLLATPTS
jgi:hypothetical protein